MLIYKSNKPFFKYFSDLINISNPEWIINTLMQYRNVPFSNVDI